MLGAHDIGWFVVAGLLLNITPGADFLYIVSRASARGFAAGVWAALGIGAGCIVHVLAAALGLSAILATSAVAFGAVKLVGAAYLVYLGVSMLWKRAAPLATANRADASSGSRGEIFAKGFLTNVLNPKVALFFLAFVPQFIDVASDTKVAAFLLLGTIFNVNGTLWNVFVAWATARMAARVRATAGAMTWLNRAVGVVFVYLGAKLALAERG
jgi:threonine/homoserine/homoserine lactone efflux protein